MEDVLIKMIVHIVRGYKLVKWTVSCDGKDQGSKERSVNNHGESIQLNLDISNTDIFNTIDISKWFVSPNHLIFKLFSLDILNTQISQTL